MRDLELIHIADTGAIPPEVVDAAYVAASPGGVLDDTTLIDPSYTDTKAYTKPSLGGEFGPAAALLLGGPADGGEAALAAAAVVTVTAPVVPTPPNAMALGRAANNTSFGNLYPWHKTPPEGLDQNNPNPPPAPAPAPPPPPTPTGVTVTGNTLLSNTGSASFSGPAARNATVTLTYSLNGNPNVQLTVAILAGDTGSQIAARVRSAIDAVFGLDATGTGGTVNVVGLGGVLTYFFITVS